MPPRPAYRPVPSGAADDPAAHALLLEDARPPRPEEVLGADRYAFALLTTLSRRSPRLRTEHHEVDALPGLDAEEPETYVLRHPDLVGDVQLDLLVRRGRADLRLQSRGGRGSRGSRARILPPDERLAHPATAEGAAALARWVDAYVRLAALGQPAAAPPTRRRRPRPGVEPLPLD